MKLELDDNSSLTICVVALVCALALVLIKGCEGEQVTKRAAIEKGYEFVAPAAGQTMKLPGGGE